MTKQDKELLLRDLCARLPYGVKVAILGSGCMTLRNLINSSIGWYADIDGAPTDFSIDEIKPYLRPMTSMTSKEWCEYCDASLIDEKSWIMAGNGDGYKFTPINNKESYLHSHHLDYMGLIEKGLALRAKEGMYKC